MSGRPRVVNKTAVLQVIRDTVIASPSELAKSLNVARATVYRRMKEIKQEEIDQALGIITEGELKPAEMELKVFSRLPEVRRFEDTLHFMRKTTATYAHRKVRALFNICIILKKKPSALTPQMMVDLLLRIRKKEVQMGEYEFRKTARVWFKFKGISGDSLTNLGIGADKKYEDRSNLKFSREHRAQVIRVIDKMRLINWSNGIITIPFAAEPYLAAAIRFLPIFMYYTGTRIGERGNDNETGALNVLWEDVTEREDMVIIKVKDKGKKGGIDWYKQLIGAARESYEEFKKETSEPP